MIKRIKQLNRTIRCSLFKIITKRGYEPHQQQLGNKDMNDGHERLTDIQALCYYDTA